MMTARSLLPLDAQNAGGAPPAQAISRPAKEASRAGDFLKFIGQAQARQNATCKMLNLQRSLQPDMTATQATAPVLSAIAPPTAKPPDQAANPASNDDKTPPSTLSIPSTPSTVYR